MKEPFAVDDVYEGFEKTAGNLQFYWILRAGHMVLYYFEQWTYSIYVQFQVPKDNPNGILYILQKVTDNFKV